jgi:hypothetical protein
VRIQFCGTDEELIQGEGARRRGTNTDPAAKVKRLPPQSMKVLAGVLVVAALVVGGGGISSGSTAGSSGGGSKLAPVGAKQPRGGAQLPSCDPVSLDPPGRIEGACTLTQVTVVAADKDHAVALKALIFDVVDVKQVNTITVPGGSYHPIAPETWIAIKVQVKNTSGRAAQLRDEQVNLLIGATRYPDITEATGIAEADSITKPNKKLGKGETRSGTVVFGVPSSDVGKLTTSPSALLFTGFGGDWGFSEFPGNVFGVIRLYQ